ncbi:PKD domain-containing protein [Patescibacteria group bacterium]|nr:PKD domain-containing protein [Patescibacteria group bacterium]
MRLNGRKLFLIGFIFVLLVGIPITVYFLQEQQETRIRAEKSTNLTFTPDSSTTNPIKKSIGDSIPLDIMVNPGTNLVSFLKLSIQYDPDKLATDSGSAFKPNTIVFPTVLEGPIYSSGKIEVTLSVGPDPTKAIQSLAKAGTITFKALANTAGQPTLVTYSSTTQVLSIGSSDQASENVLSSTTPATIIIGGTSISPTVTGTPIPIPTSSLTPTPTVTLTPTSTVTNTPTPSLTPTTAPTIATTPTVTGSVNSIPVCSTLAVDRATTGVAPFAITFTANGTDSDGTISKVNFNFGDGTVSGDISTSGGIGTDSINVATSHEYQSVGTYTASAVLTDNNGGASDSNSCQQTIIVQEETVTATPSGEVATSTPTPSIEPTGSVGTVIGIGAAAMLLIIVGGLLFFVL